mmetsp:Transcript_4517/g.6594  ORF Transcript_4517/g.6594 Transcript_4517/m.6594 type:complete len:84 (+) Transcript_4517:82-333(+)
MLLNIEHVYYRFTTTVRDGKFPSLAPTALALNHYQFVSTNRRKQLFYIQREKIIFMLQSSSSAFICKASPCITMHPRLNHQFS